MPAHHSHPDRMRLDELLVARGLFEKQGDVVWLRTPLRFGDVPLAAPPEIGQHTDEILRECGLASPT